MQTFLPYPDFTKSASVLDNRRLGKQRVECLQILQTLAKGPEVCAVCKTPVDSSFVHGSAPYIVCPTCKSCRTIVTPWSKHPAVKMWRGYTGALVCYGRAVCHEWIKRGFNDTCLAKIDDLALPFGGMPSFIGNPAFHASHRSNLLRKDPKWYGQFGWTEPSDLPYVWPV